ncbi:MAG: hypothetical protein ACI8WT_001157, partial [Clostridium sp.]
FEYLRVIFRGIGNNIIASVNKNTIIPLNILTSQFT